MSALLEARGLRRHFATGGGLPWKRQGRVVAVDGVDLDIERGEIVALVGESGSGKTTLARCLLRLIEPTAGSVRWAGDDPLAMDRRELRQRRRSLQMVFQDPRGSLNPRLRVEEALWEPVRAHGLAPAADREALVLRLLAEVGLPAETARRFPHELSGGQRQRVGIARALATSPELLVADEPVSALDVSVRGQVMNLLLDLRARRGLAILIIAHDLALVGHVADRVVVLYLGRVVEEGAAGDVLREPLHPYTVALVSAVPSPDPSIRPRRTVLAGEPPSPIRPPRGCRFHPRCPIAERRCSVESPLLADAGDGRRVACHYPGRLALPPSSRGMEPFAAADVERTDAGHGATQ